MKQAIDESLGLDDRHLQRWLVTADKMIVRAATSAVNADQLETLVSRFEAGEPLKAARLRWAIMQTGFHDGASAERDGRTANQAQLIQDLIKRSGDTSDEAQQLEMVSSSCEIS